MPKTPKNATRRIVMKRSIGRTTVVIAFLAAVAFSIVPTAQAQQCTLAGAAGAYSFTLTGTLILPGGPVPAAAVGRFTADPSGKITGTEARNVGGGFANETLTGTLTVHPDCTAKATFNVFESGVLVRKTVFSTVFDDNLTAFRSIEQSLVLEPAGTRVPAVITTEGKRLF
jgi:hypothetical protein